MSLIVRTMWGPEGEVFLLSCDDTCLDWLEVNFDMLARGHVPAPAFLIGDGRPVMAAGDLHILVRRSNDESPMQIIRQGRQLIWFISCDTAKRFRELTQSLRQSTGPGHQYLESPDPSVPTVVLSKNEYDEVALRAMSLDEPA